MYELKKKLQPLFIGRSIACLILSSNVILYGSAKLYVAFFNVGLGGFFNANIWHKGPFFIRREVKKKQNYALLT
jgi:hypothetical protein